MAFSEDEFEQCDKLVGTFVRKRRLPEDIRAEVDLAYRIQDQSIEIFEIRPVFLKKDEKVEEPVAKATYVRKLDIWKVYWMRADLNWHAYPLHPEAKGIEEFLELVAEDATCCFWG